MTPDRFALLVQSVSRATKDVETITPAIAEAQWSPSRKMAPAPLRESDMVDTGIRSKGEYSDPTGETAVDLRRARVRREVRTAEDHLLRALAYLNGAHAALDRALGAWEGLPPRY